MSYMENVQKPKENPQISWFGGYLGVYGEPFFMIFLCGTCCSGFWGALWRLWDAIMLLGVALGGHWAPKGSPMVIFGSVPHSGKLRVMGFGGPKVCFLHIIYVYITDICHIWKMYKNLRKTFKFQGSAAIGGVYGRLFFLSFLCGTCCGEF